MRCMALQQVDACNIDNRMKLQQVELEEMTSVIAASGSTKGADAVVLLQQVEAAE